MDSEDRRKFDQIILNSAKGLTPAKKMEVLCFNWQHNHENTNSSLTIKLNEQVDYKLELVDKKVREYNINFRINPNDENYFTCHDKRHRTFYFERPKDVEIMKILTDLHIKMSKIFEIGGFGYHCEASETALKELRALVPLPDEEYGMKTPLRSLIFKKVDLESIETILKYTTDYLEIRMNPNRIRSMDPDQKNRFETPIKARDVKIESAFWMTCDNILTSESCRRVRLNQFKWNDFEFNHFVDEWKNSRNTKLEFLRITYEKEFCLKASEMMKEFNMEKTMETDTVDIGNYLKVFETKKEFNLETVAELKLKPYNCLHRTNQLDSDPRLAYEVTRSDGYKATIHLFKNSDGTAVIHMFVWKPTEFYPYWEKKEEAKTVLSKCEKKDFDDYIIPPAFPETLIRREADSFFWHCGWPNMNPSLTIQLKEGLTYKFEIFKGIVFNSSIKTSFPKTSCEQVIKDDLTYRIRAHGSEWNTLREVSYHLLKKLRPRVCSFSSKLENFPTDLSHTLLDWDQDLRTVPFCRSITFKEVPFDDNSMERVRKFPSDRLDIQMMGLHKEPIDKKDKRRSNEKDTESKKKSNEDATVVNRTVYNGRGFKARDLKIQGDSWIDPMVLLKSPVTQRIRLNHVRKENFNISSFVYQWSTVEPFNKILESIRVIYTGTIKPINFTKNKCDPESVRRRKLDPFKSGHRVDQLGKEAIEVERSDQYKATVHFKDDKQSDENGKEVMITTVHMFIWTPHESYPYF